MNTEKQAEEVKPIRAWAVYFTHEDGCSFCWLYKTEMDALSCGNTPIEVLITPVSPLPDKVQEIAQESHSERSVIEQLRVDNKKLLKARTDLQRKIVEMMDNEEECRKIIQNNIDRDKGDETLLQLVNIVCNALYWSRKEDQPTEALTASPENKEEGFGSWKEITPISDREQSVIWENIAQNNKRELDLARAHNGVLRKEKEELQAQVTELKDKLSKWTNWENGLNIEQWSLNVCERNDRLGSQVERYREIIKEISNDLTWASWLSSISIKARTEIKECIAKLDALQTNPSSTPAEKGDFHPQIPVPVPCEEVKEPSVEKILKILHAAFHREAHRDLPLYSVPFTRDEFYLLNDAIEAMAADYKKGEADS